MFRKSVLAFAFVHVSVHAGPPAAQIMPKSTKQFIVIPNLQRFDANLNRTQLGKMHDDPALKPLVNELQKTADMYGTGITWADVKRVGDGEISFAAIADDNGKPVSAMTLQANGKGKKLAALIARSEARFATQGFRKSQQNANGAMIVSQRKPGPIGKNPKRKVHYFVRDEMFVSCADLSILRAMAARWTAATHSSLQNVTAFQKTQHTCKTQSKRDPDVIAFVEPFGLAEAYEAIHPRKPGEPDSIKQLRTEGFDAVQGIGSAICFGVDGRLIDARIAVYAPPPYRKSMRMIRLLGGVAFSPPRFIPSDAASYSAAGFDLLNAFKHFGSFFDTFVAEGDAGTFHDIVTDMKTDPDGPMVDLEKEVIGQLYPHIYYYLDVPDDLKPYREQSVLAIKVKNEKALLAKLDRLLNGDPDVKRKRVRDKYIVWELWSDKQGRLKKKILNKVICLAHGCFLSSSHPLTMAKVLANLDRRLDDKTDFRLVASHFKKTPGDHVLRIFSRPERELRNIYDLYKNGKLDEDSSGNPVYRALLRRVGANVNRSSLPSFDRLIRYVGPIGVAAVNRDDGWLLTAFSLETK